MQNTGIRCYARCLQLADEPALGRRQEGQQRGRAKLMKAGAAKLYDARSTIGYSRGGDDEPTGQLRSWRRSTDSRPSSTCLGVFYLSSAALLLAAERLEVAARRNKRMAEESVTNPVN